MKKIFILIFSLNLIKITLNEEKEKEKIKCYDSNCLTCGTEFLHSCIECTNNYILHLGDCGTYEECAKMIRKILWAMQISPWSANDNYYNPPQNSLDYAKTTSLVMDNVYFTYMGLRVDNPFYFFMSKPDGVDYIEELFKDTEYTDKPQYCMVESAVWFPSVSRRDVIGKLPMEFHPEITLLESALDSPQKYIDGIYDFYEGWKHTRLPRPGNTRRADAARGG
jgi:hypothetical protein